MLEEHKKAVLTADDELKQLELQIKREELEQLRLTKEERQYSIKDLKGRLAEREVKEIQRAQDRTQRGKTLLHDKFADEVKWAKCTHRKGGKVSARDMNVLTFGGDSDQYAVLKHIMINGDLWIRCLRCGKTWAPPLKIKFYFDEDGKPTTEKLGKFDQEKFDAAVKEYRTAVQFPTTNTTSSSVIVTFSKWNDRHEKVDASQDFREAMADTNLR
jgi:hypothetical protein